MLTVIQAIENRFTDFHFLLVTHFVGKLGQLAYFFYHSKHGAAKRVYSSSCNLNCIS